MLAFRSLELSDQEMVNRYMSRFGGCSCQHSFCALYTLSDKYGSRICEQDGFLYTLREGQCREGERVYLPPMGEGDLKAAYEVILTDAEEHGCRPVFRTITRDQLEFLEKEFPGKFKHAEIRDYSEYIYSTEVLCNMPGGKYADKRNKIKRLLKTYGERLEVRLLSLEDVPAIWEFELSWLAENAETHDAEALELEKSVIRKQLDHFDELGLKGIGAFLDGEMVGFYYGVALNKLCFDGLIEKARRDVPNLYRLLNWKVSCLCAAPYHYFTWEEDVGVPGLRYTKMEYGPAILLRKYLVTTAEASESAGECAPICSDCEPYPGEELIPDVFPEHIINRQR